MPQPVKLAIIFLLARGGNINEQNGMGQESFFSDSLSILLTAKIRKSESLKKKSRP
jgi:hypothetical protein